MTASRIIYKTEDANLFWHYWERYVAEHHSSPRYLRTTIEYYLAILRGAGNLDSDKSFLYVVNNEPVACVFLPIIRQGEDLVIAMDGDYVFAPLCHDVNVQKKIFALIDDIARSCNLAKICFSIDPLENNERHFNFLQAYNYLDVSILTYMVDLSQGKNVEELLQKCHSRYKRSVKKILSDKRFQTFIVDADHLSRPLFDNYVALHHKCAGRITRVQESFDIQFEKIKNGHAVLIGLKYEDKPIAYYYFVYSADKAFAFSSADDPEYDALPLYHILFYRQMEYLKNLGINYIDTEQPANPSQQFDCYPEDKQLNTSFFKQGLVGSFVNQSRGIKYFSQKVFDADMEIFEKNYKIL